MTRTYRAVLNKSGMTTTATKNGTTVVRSGILCFFFTLMEMLQALLWFGNMKPEVDCWLMGDTLCLVKEVSLYS